MSFDFLILELSYYEKLTCLVSVYLLKDRPVITRTGGFACSTVWHCLPFFTGLRIESRMSKSITFNHWSGAQNEAENGSRGRCLVKQRSDQGAH